MKPDDLLSCYPNIETAILDKELASLGDALVNLIYSLGLSIARGRAEGAKVSNLVLAKALTSAGLRHLAPSRADRQQLADVAEATVACAWLRGVITLERAAETIADELVKRDFSDRKDIQDGAEKGFTRLLSNVRRGLKLGESEVSGNQV